MKIVQRKGKFIITKAQGGEYTLWEKVKTGRDYIIFQHFGDQLYARYDSHHTPIDTGITIPEWHAFQRAEASGIIQGILNGEKKKSKHVLVPAFSGT